MTDDILSFRAVWLSIYLWRPMNCKFDCKVYRVRPVSLTVCIGILLFLSSLLPFKTSAFLLTRSHAAPVAQQLLESIRVSVDGTHFESASSKERFVVWGVNYDHDSDGRLLDEYWVEEWPTVVADFQEIKGLGANTVRVHLQVGTFLDAPRRFKEESLHQLGRLVDLAESTGLFLDITGLACYHKKNIPAWYDAMSEEDRWETQAFFWEGIANTCKASPAIFCYDLMNEPIVPGAKLETDWLTGELGGKFFVQRLSLDAKGRTQKQIAEAWVNRMTKAIRAKDKEHLITVGVIPWVFVFGGGEPLFYSPEVSKSLDFAAVHFYPEEGKVDQAIRALKKYDIGKPLIVEEMFPLKASSDTLEEFIRRSSNHTDGWLSFYWGTSAKSLREKKEGTITDAIVASWIERFESLSPSAKSGQWPSR